MKNIITLAWQVLPLTRRIRRTRHALWIQLPIPSRNVERRVTNFMALAGHDCRAKFVRVSDDVHEQLFCILRVDLAQRCCECGAKFDETDYDNCEDCFYRELVD
jgi:hypothetical protein